MASPRVEEFSSSTSQCAYDVFLSFRGKETRKTFTDHLYIALLDAGFRTFRDEEGIEVGENIKLELWKAIQDSRISIVVFSKDYASSCWCLDELLMILKRRRASGHEVLPIFYNMDPTLIKKQKERYMEAFARHEEQFIAEVDERKVEWVDKLKEWWAALEELADLGGMVSKDQDDGDESKFIQKVVIAVQDKINRTISSVSPNLIGMHTRAEDINTWLQDESSDVGMAAICGMGGIGKTTIAKMVYNLNFSSFDGVSFLANIREISGQPRGLIRLQKKLLSDILRERKEKIYSIDEGIVKIKAALYCKRVLVVLDDIDKMEQLDAILGVRDWFFQGSKIVITTRHERLLRAHETCKIYRVEKLDDAESLELFSWHAFGQDHPTDDYEADSRRMVHYCEGLPLAIKVLGSSLSGKSLDVWKSHLEKLKAFPNSKVLEKLKISYENLQDEHDKNLFLHIACFFVGKDKDWTVQVLNECDVFPTIGIQNLIDRCMLSIDFGNKLRMHRLIQDMGREIVQKESPDEPGKRSRIWNHDDSFDILAEKTGTEKIEGLILDLQLLKGNEFRKTVIRVNRKRSSEEFMETSMLFDQCNSPKRQCFSMISWNPVSVAQGNCSKIVFEINAFAKMCKLRLLQLNFVQLSGSFEKFPETLRWLSWHGFPFESIHNAFSLDTVVALDMRYSRLKNVWDGGKGLHEEGIFSTFFPGGEVPDWFSNKSGGSTISFTVCSLPNCRFQGLNFCCVYALSNKEEICWPPPLFAKVCNKSKDLRWIYGALGFVIPKAGEEVIWLSHWKLGNYLDAGDTVTVQVVVDVGFQVKECGINHVCEQDQEDIHKASFDHCRLDACIYGHIPMVSEKSINGAHFVGTRINFSRGRSSLSYHLSRFDWSQKIVGGLHRNNRPSGSTR